MEQKGIIVLEEKKTSTRKRTTTKKATKPAAETVKEVVAPAEKVSVKEKFDIHDYVTVRNGFQGKLVYKSKRTGELFIWDDFGDEQDIELRDLKDAKSSAKNMFIKNYFMFEDEDVIEYLGVKHFYDKSISLEDFDTIFDMEPEEIKKTIKNMPEGQKSSLAYKARKLCKHNAIDSLKVITALEESLHIRLRDED